jgi:eukaryotic-like serine/threonine-protein kinase
VTPERWKTVEQIVDGAMSCDVDARKAFVVEACRGDADLESEVMSLLSYADERDSFLTSAVMSATHLLDHRRATDDAPRVMVGRRVGAYEIVRPLASGGMGTVYLAKRVDDHFESQVAIKIIKLGMDTEEILRRFRTERQLLANLAHGNIARLLDGGTTDDGRPYLVMEYIDGLPIDQYCDNRRLTVRRRLELFRSVLKGVQFAHQNLVVHRDLKPGNILVTEDGVPKLLDFGIAKLLRPDSASDTQTAVSPMTPDYACPEQIHGRPITTASDVYSLGVVLYELLSGRKPFSRKLSVRPTAGGASGDAMSDAESPPPLSRPSSGIDQTAALRDSSPDRMRRVLSGDLEKGA